MKNRAQRRAVEKAKKKAAKDTRLQQKAFTNHALNVMNKQMSLHMDDLRRQNFEDTFAGFLALFCLVLHDKFGFGKKRLTIVISYAIEMFNDVGDGRLTFDDMRQALKEETGIEL